MYDTVNLWISGASTHLAPHLSRVAEHKREQNYYVTGDLKNLNVVLSDRGTSIKGSLCKWFKGDNLQSLTRTDTKRAFEVLADAIHLPILKAKVSRIDVANNLLMEHPPTVYYRYLGESFTFKRFTKDKSLYYEKSNISKLFYDKIAESKAKNVFLNNELRNQNLLRFETRFTKKLSDTFNVAEVTPAMLYEETFYKNIINKWVNEYENINKIRKMGFKDGIELEPKDFTNQLLLKSIMDFGGQNEVINLIKEARKKGQFKRPEYASRTESMIKEICKIANLTEPSELIIELDTKIREVPLIYL